LKQFRISHQARAILSMTRTCCISLIESVAMCHNILNKFLPRGLKDQIFHHETLADFLENFGSACAFNATCLGGRLSLPRKESSRWPSCRPKKRVFVVSRKTLRLHPARGGVLRTRNKPSCRLEFQMNLFPWSDRRYTLEIVLLSIPFKKPMSIQLFDNVMISR